MAEQEICPVCGSKMDDDAKACSVCGTAFQTASQQCPHCKAELDGGEAACPDCAADLSSPQVNEMATEDVGIDLTPPEGDRGAAREIADSVFVNVELEELVKLPGVGPLRAKILFEAGYTDLRKLKQASVVELMNIRGIGRKAAGEIKTALRELSLEEIREKPLTRETVGEENQCPLCATIVSAYETSCYECGCEFGEKDLDSGDSDRLALSYYDSKLLRAPDSKDLWYARGATLAKMGNYEQALNSFNRAIEIDPSFQTAWMSKAEVYNKMGESAKAAECYSHIITAASGGQMPGAEETETVMPADKEDEDLELEPPTQTAPEPAPEQPKETEVAQPDIAQEPVEYGAEPEVLKPTGLDFSEMQMDYKKPPEEMPDLDSMNDAELKKELSRLAIKVKPYLKLAKEIGVDINHAKKLVSRAVTESKQNELRVAIQLMHEGMDFAESEFRRKVLDDIEGLATVIRDLKMQGKDVSVPSSLVADVRELLDAGMIQESVDKLRICLESVERIVS